MRKLTKYTRVVVAAAIAGLATLTLATPASAHARAKPTIVLVHGAWADESSWSAVAGKLRHDGYTVDVPSNPLRGVASDAASIAAYLKKIHGPVVLVGHSYGGMVITNAALGNKNIKSLVYVDAYIPDKGDTVSSLTGEKSVLAVADPSTVFTITPIPNGGGNVDLLVKPELFPGFFAADLPAAQGAALAAKQHPLAGTALTEASGAPAWKTIPSWAVIGTADRVIPSAQQQFMTARAKSHVVTIDAPHLSMVSKPDAVKKLIEAAAHC